MTAKTWNKRRIVVWLGLSCSLALATLAGWRSISLHRQLEQLSFSRQILSNDHSWLHGFLNNEGRIRLALAKNEIGNFKPALLCFEDQRFYSHPGVDPLALIRAFWQNITAGRVVSGASTITMQLARRLTPGPRRWNVKLREAFEAILLELLFAKDDILIHYLNLTPYGGNIEGLKAASELFFGKLPRELTAYEIAYLLAVPQNPGLLKQPWQKQKRTVVKILNRLIDCALASKQHLALALAAEKPPRRRAMPRTAPAWSAWLARQDQATIVNSTIDQELQSIVKRNVQRVRIHLQDRDIRHIAVLVVENSSRAVVAALGSFTFFSETPGSNYPAFAVARSPGSTLKPLVFSLGLAAGEIVPRTLLVDVPVAFGRWRPQNYSGHFLGLVSAEQALALSLNVPFVHLLQKVGYENLLGHLQAIGLSSVRQQQPGLTLVVGGAELTLLELMQVYVNFANLGQHQALRLRTDQLPGPIFRWLPEQAVWLTNQILASRQRPDFAENLAPTHASKTVYWKTGTSQNRRDAWTLGFNRRFTVGVWLGNLDQSEAPYLVGAQAAAPLFFDILSAISNAEDFQPLLRPSGLTEVEICAFSGLRPTAACPHRTLSLAPSSQTVYNLCPWHRTNISNLCHTEGSAKKSFLDLPTTITQWYPNPEPHPRYAPECSGELAVAEPLTIHFPPLDQEFLRWDKQQPQVLIPIRLSSKAGELQCFLDDQPIPAQDLHKGIVAVSLGRHKIHCANRHGGYAKTHFYVRNGVP